MITTIRKRFRKWRAGRKRRDNPDVRGRLLFMASQIFHGLAVVKIAETFAPADRLRALEKQFDLFLELKRFLDETPRDTLRCKACDRCGFGYMLTNDLWKQVADEEEDLLCLQCVQARLDRPLRREDFTDVPLNEPIFAAMEIGASKPREVS